MLQNPYKNWEYKGYVFAVQPNTDPPSLYQPGLQWECRLRGDLKRPNLSQQDRTYIHAGGLLFLLVCSCLPNFPIFPSWQRRERKELLLQRWRSFSLRQPLESRRTSSLIGLSSLSSRIERIKSLFLLARSQTLQRYDLYEIYWISTTFKIINQRAKGQEDTSWWGHSSY